jgi:hypothetical protein
MIFSCSFCVFIWWITTLILSTCWMITCFFSFRVIIWLDDNIRCELSGWMIIWVFLKLPMAFFASCHLVSVFASYRFILQVKFGILLQAKQCKILLILHLFALMQNDRHTLLWSCCLLMEGLLSSAIYCCGVVAVRKVFQLIPSLHGEKNSPSLHRSSLLRFFCFHYFSKFCERRL